MVLIETERLRLREYTTEDAAFIFELMNSEGWLKYIGDRNIKTVGDAVAFIEKYYLPSYKINGYGALMVILKESGKPIGSCGLYKRENLKHPDVGFAFLGEYLGKGFGFEAAQAVMKFSNESLKIETILGFTVPDNIASIKLLEKLGLKQKGTYFLKDNPDELLLFSN
jgi:RimJ/RimL family protein N-acetyltransferase